MEEGMSVDSHLAMEKTGEQYLGHVNKATVINDRSCGWHVPLIACDDGVTSTLQTPSPKH